MLLIFCKLYRLMFLDGLQFLTYGIMILNELRFTPQSCLLNPRINLHQITLSLIKQPLLPVPNLADTDTVAALRHLRQDRFGLLRRA